MRKILFLLALQIAASANGPVWTDLRTIPGTSINIFFSTYDYHTKSVIATWIDGGGNGFSSSFDGLDWGQPISVPNMGSFTGVLATAYDPAINRVVCTFADATGFAYSSIYDGTQWSPKQSIPVPTDALLLFPAYDKAIGKLVATWSDTGSMVSSSSVFDGINWSQTAQDIGTTNAIFVFPVYNPSNNTFVGIWVNGITMDGYAATFDGNSWSAPTLVASNLTPPNFIPLFNLTSMHEQLIATWVDNTTSQGFYAIFNGSSWSGPLEIPGVNANSAIFPIVNPALDEIVIMWVDSTTLIGFFSTYDGTRWTTPEAIPGTGNTSDILGAYDPSIGKLVATWRDLTTGQGYSTILCSPSITFTGTGNLASLAQYINSIGQTGAMQPILGRLNKLGASDLESALASINIARNAFMPYMAGQISIQFSKMLEMHSSELRWISMNHIFQSYSDMIGLTASLEMPKEKQSSCKPDFGVWLEGIGSYSHQNEQDQNPSFDAWTGGAILGIDSYNENMSVISSFGYARTHIDDDNSSGKSDVDSVMALFNGCGTIVDRGYVEFGLAGVYNHYDSDRHISFPGFNSRAKASFSGAQIIPHLAFGYDYCLGDWVLEPFASADCAVIFQSSFEEEGAEPLNADQPSSWSELLQARAGLRAYLSGAPCWGIWYFQMSGAYQYIKSFDVGSIANASFVGLPSGFTVISLESGQNCFAPGLEYFARFHNGFFTSVNYSGEFGSKYMSNSLFAKIGWFF